MPRLLLDERIRADGSSSQSWAEVVPGASERVRLIDDDGVDGYLSIAALDRVMVRFGRPLDDSIALDGEALDLGAGRRLRRLHYHAVVDAEGRDYLVWERPSEEPIAVIATMATAALRHLVLRLAPGRPQESEG